MDFINGVRHFNLAAGRTEDRYDPRAIALHTGLQLEEMAEVLEAMLKHASEAERISAWRVKTLIDSLHAVGADFKKGTFDRLAEIADRKDLLDGCIDVKVVSIGSCMSQGADVIGATNEVNRANLAKIGQDGKCIKDTNGKIQKPPGWVPPNLSPYVCKD